MPAALRSRPARAIPRAAVAAVVALAATTAPAVHAASSDADAAMLALAERHGCTACHQVEPGGQARDGLAPLGPAWRDVSLKYTGERSVEDRLVATVLGGSRPHLSHWKGERSGASMPAQQPAISPEDARALVRWILALGPRP